MSGLRTINNNYRDFAGTRGDYIVVGDPGFKGGKNCNYGIPFDARSPTWWNGPRDLQVPVEWNTTPQKSMPGGSIAKTRSLNRLVNHVSHPASRASLHQRALEKASSSPALLSVPRSDKAEAFDTFLADVVSNDNVAGFSRASVGCKRHVDQMNQELAEVRRRFKENPQATTRSLRESDSWKYYALHARKARNLQSICRREGPKSFDIIEKARAKNVRETKDHRRGYHISWASHA